MKILFLHGRAQEGRTENDIREEWLTALNRGLAAVGSPLVAAQDVIVPYYGDELFEAAQQQRDDPNFKVRNADSQDRFLEEVASEVIAQQGPGGLVDATSTGGDPNNLRDRGVENWPWVIRAVRFLDDRFPSISGRSISKILIDVHLYLTDDKIQNAVNSIIKKTIPDEPFLMLSHSLGTVVAYNVMRESSSVFNTLITIGSPLGINAVKKRLKQPLNRPDVSMWSNLYDPQDIVALNPLNSAHFAIFNGAMAITDYSVKNDSENHHNITPYLIHSTTAREIAGALAREPRL